MRRTNGVVAIGSLVICLGVGHVIRAADVAVRKSAATSAAAARAKAPKAVARQQVVVVRAQNADVAPLAPAAPAEPYTLWTFLGVPNHRQMAACKDKCARLPLVQAIQGATAPLCGVMGLIPGPPPLAAPENLKSAIPAVKAAAQVKQQEDAVPAKIQAIRYLAKIGCDCYPQVREALLAALDDCNEKVRLEAAKAIAKSRCCHPDLLKKLNEIANELDAFGHHKEHSRRVRKAAMEAIEACACRVLPEAPAEPQPEPEPAPGPEQPPAPPPAQALRQTSGAEMNAIRDGSGRASVGLPAGAELSTFTESQNPNSVTSGLSPYVGTAYAEGMESESGWVESAGTDLAPGTVVWVDTARGMVHLHFPGGQAPAIGTSLKVFHRYPLKLAYVGDLVVTDTMGGQVAARPAGSVVMRKVKKGDQATVR